MTDRKYNRVLVVGDIHGCAIALKTLLREVQPQLDDLVITLGDCVDRGFASYEVLETLISLHALGILVPLRGNHEMLLLLNCRKRDGSLHKHDHISPRQLFVDAQSSNLKLRMDKIKMSGLTSNWQKCGSLATIESYMQANCDGLAVMPNHHFHFLEHDCVDWHELDNFVFVHGGVSTSEPVEKTDIQLLHWKRTNSLTEPLHCSGKTVVCGHNVQANGRPTLGENAICLDTGVCYGGWLSCLDLNSGECWQANEQGKLAKAMLRDFTLYGEMLTLQIASVFTKEAFA